MRICILVTTTCKKRLKTFHKNFSTHCLRRKWISFFRIQVGVHFLKSDLLWRCPFQSFFRVLFCLHLRGNPAQGKESYLQRSRKLTGEAGIFVYVLQCAAFCKIQVTKQIWRYSFSVNHVVFFILKNKGFLCFSYMISMENGIFVVLKV